MGAFNKDATSSRVYEARFGKLNHSNENINEIVSRNVEEIPDHDLNSSVKIFF